MLLQKTRINLVVLILIFISLMLDGNITIDSHGGDMRGCRSIALIGGCSVPEKHYETGVVHVDFVHGHNGPLALHSVSIFFAVCSSKVDSCFYRGACQFELCTIRSYHSKNDPIIVYLCKRIITQ